MSKKSSPQSRSTRRPRTRGPQQSRVSGASAGSGERSSNRTVRTDRKATAEQPSPAPVNFRGRLRRYLPTALIPNVVAVLSVIVVALAVLLLGSVEMAALPATIAQFWLTLNLVPIAYDGTDIGLLPMLPATGLVWLISRQVNKAVRDRVSVADLGVLLLWILVVPSVLTGIAAGMLWDAGAVYPVAPPEILQALARVVALHLVAMVFGMGAKLWRALFRRYGLPDAFVDNARTALRWLGYLGVAALVVLVIAMALGWRRQAELAGIYNGTGALIALALVCLLYLPNALIGVSAVLVGAEFHIGEASVSLFSIHHTPLPPMPLIAAIPAESQPWFPVLLVIPAAVAGYLAYRANPTLISAVATGLFAGIFMLVAGYLSQGILGGFGPTGPMVLLSAGLVFAWLTLSGITTALLLKLAERRQSRGEPADKSAPYIEENIGEGTAENPDGEAEPVVGEDDADAAEADEDETAEDADDSGENGVDNDIAAEEPGVADGDADTEAGAAGGAEPDDAELPGGETVESGADTAESTGDEGEDGDTEGRSGAARG